MTDIAEDPAAAEEDADHPYSMTVDLAVVESLGINLYSNAAAVLSSAWRTTFTRTRRR